MLPEEVLHDLPHIDIHVIVGLHHKLRLATELPRPLDPGQRLEGEVLVGVQEVFPHQVPVQRSLLRYPLLQLWVWGGGGAKEEDQLGIALCLEHKHTSVLIPPLYTCRYLYQIATGAPCVPDGSPSVPMF